jgi:hypothetical protein
MIKTNKLERVLNTTPKNSLLPERNNFMAAEDKGKQTTTQMAYSLQIFWLQL